MKLIKTLLSCINSFKSLHLLTNKYTLVPRELRRKNISVTPFPIRIFVRKNFDKHLIHLRTIYFYNVTISLSIVTLLSELVSVIKVIYVLFYLTPHYHN